MIAKISKNLIYKNFIYLLMAMSHKIFLQFFLLLFLCGCNLISQIQQTTSVIEENRSTIADSTQTIARNADAVEHSSIIIKRNEKLINETNQAIHENLLSVKKSSEAIRDNALLIESSTQIIKENKNVIEQSNHGILKNVQLIDSLTEPLSKFNPSFLSILAGVLLFLLIVPWIILMIFMGRMNYHLRKISDQSSTEKK